MPKATFAAGCFWGPEEAFAALDGVEATRVGYTGGHLPHPRYEQVCRGDSGHAEAVEVDFDPARIAYEELLAVFWRIHDPTSLNRQGPDIGSQYRSAIFVHDDAQRTAAEASRRAAQQRLLGAGASRGQGSPEAALPADGGGGRAIVTEIVAAGRFWPAEDYHQRFLEKRRLAGWFRRAG